MVTLAILTLNPTSSDENKGIINEQNSEFTVDLEIKIDGKTLEGKGGKGVKLRAKPEVFNVYRQWQYENQQLGRATARLQQGAIQETNVDLEKLKNNLKALEQQLLEAINEWLSSPGFTRIRDELSGLLKNPELRDEVRVIVKTDYDQLRRIPWHLWELIEGSKKNIEVGLAGPEFEKREPTITFGDKIRILAILGDSTGIDIEKDQQFLEDLQNADPKFLPEPNGEQITNLLKQSWDILFFAGHSYSTQDGQTGVIHLNQQEKWSIDQLKESLKKAIANGLQLAIFNSCDGLGIAKQLEKLNIPVTIVMREPVPDLVAQKFLKEFLQEYSRGTSLYLAVHEARQQLEEFNQKFSGASWLPVICQNPAIEPPSWDQLLKRRNRRRSPRRSPEQVTLLFMELIILPENIISYGNLELEGLDKKIAEKLSQNEMNGRIFRNSDKRFFLVFADFDKAVQFARDLQSSYNNKFKIAIHFGSPEHQKENDNKQDFFGRDVELTEHLLGLADRDRNFNGQILLSESASKGFNNHILGKKEKLYDHGDRIWNNTTEVRVFELLYRDRQRPFCKAQKVKKIPKFILFLLNKIKVPKVPKFILILLGIISGISLSFVYWYFQVVRIPCGKATKPLEGISRIAVSVSTIGDLRFPEIDRKQIEKEIANKIIEELKIVGITGELKQNGKQYDGIMQASYSEIVIGKLQKNKQPSDDMGIKGYDYVTQSQLELRLNTSSNQEVFNKSFFSEGAYHSMDINDSNLELRNSAFEGTLSSMNGMLKPLSKPLPLCTNFNFQGKLYWSMGVIEDQLIFPVDNDVNNNDVANTVVDIYNIKDVKKIAKEEPITLSFKSKNADQIVGQQGNILIFANTGYPQELFPIYFVDFSDFKNPKLVGQYVTKGQIERAGIIGDYLIVNGGGGFDRPLEILDFSSPDKVKPAELDPEVKNALNNCRDFVIDGNRLYIMHFFGMVEIIRLNENGKLEHTGGKIKIDDISAIAVANNIIYALVYGNERNMSIKTYDASNSGNIRFKSQLDTGEESVSNLDKLYVSSGQVIAILNKVVVASIAKNGKLNLDGYLDTPGYDVRGVSVIPKHNIFVLMSSEYELGAKGSERGTISIYGLP